MDNKVFTAVLVGAAVIGGLAGVAIAKRLPDEFSIGKLNFKRKKKQ